MTREKQVEILMLDNCTKREAENHLKSRILYNLLNFKNF